MSNGADIGRRINASPTKEFFIYMLTRDVQLTRAVLDLVDNCVDGAQRLRGDGRYEGLWVRIELSREAFTISDNCGGIPVDLARNYAFRFGRPRAAQEAARSVGLFGVGMKRTFFKLGRWFSVSSRCQREEFALSVDVDKWMHGGDDAAPDDWHFEFDTVDEHAQEVPEEATGTSITVRGLHPSIADSFELENFHSQLIAELRAAHTLNLERGLAVTVNQVPIDYLPQRLLQSAELQPAYVAKAYPRKEIDGEQGEPVRVKLYAGLAERNYHDGGWYVFCNGRLVLKADKGSTTIWGPLHGTRQYHPDFAFFRGYAFFDCVHATLLPWTTTKTGVDSDSRIYKVVQREMVEISKPILAYLIGLAKQRADDGGEEFAAAVNAATAVEATTITTPAPFRAPPPVAQPAGPKMQKIQYAKPLDEVERAKALLKVNSFKEVGERTFEYFMEYEGGE